MRLEVIIDDQVLAVNVPDGVLSEAGGVFAKMDADMDGGWQMGREWVEQPDTDQRCQIVANRLLTALETDNQSLATMMAAYILTRRPGTTGVRVDTQGEMLATEFFPEAAPGGGHAL
ncbi:MAG: hypothetical protein GWO02_16885 [Gammaproteobacteria bacterium]|nr:hypothetical protein [Gammaproteobacteria bacterium]